MATRSWVKSGIGSLGIILHTGSGMLLTALIGIQPSLGLAEDPQSPQMAGVSSTPDSSHPPLLLSLPQVPEAEVVTQLPDVTVRGKQDALEAAKRHLAKVTAGLPCVGCDGKPQDGPPLLLTVPLLFLPTTPVEPSHEPDDRARMDSQAGLCTPDNAFGCIWGY